MRYYFAGAYARRAELEARAAELKFGPAGAEVVSRWLFDPQEGDDAGFSAGGLNDPYTINLAWEYGQRDVEDLTKADAIVSFTGEGLRGGRHIEHGMAISYYDNHPWDLSDRKGPIRLIVVGPREHVFHCHPATEVYPDWAAFLAHEIEQYREENR
jgi:hypothetical protein